MANIKVHLLNFHGFHTHIEIVLENTSTEPHTYYGLNRWEQPRNEWGDVAKPYIEQASTVYSFDIEEDPDNITNSWLKYWNDTTSSANIFRTNCAASTQWFLTEFAGIPAPNLSNVSWNHLIFGIVWPSFIPCPVILPGRIMSNAKFYIEARNHPEKAQQYNRLFLYTSMALATFVLSMSVIALAVAATLLSGIVAALVISACAAVAAGSTYAFFKARNVISAQNIAKDLKGNEEYTYEDETLLTPLANANHA